VSVERFDSAVSTPNNDETSRSISEIGERIRSRSGSSTSVKEKGDVVGGVMMVEERELLSASFEDEASGTSVSLCRV
jgi:hypothetical protein